MAGGPWVPMWKPDPTVFVSDSSAWHSGWAVSGMVVSCWVIWVSSNKPGSLCSGPVNLSLCFTWRLVPWRKVWTKRCISRCVCHGDSGVWRQPLPSSSSVSSASGAASSAVRECLLSLLIQTALIMDSAGAGRFPPEKARHRQGHRWKVQGQPSVGGFSELSSWESPCPGHLGGQIPSARAISNTHPFTHNYSFIPLLSIMCQAETKSTPSWYGLVK